MDTKRFHTPQYKKQIHANRTHRRNATPRPEHNFGKILHKIGLKNPARQIAGAVIFLLIIYLAYFAPFLKIQNLNIQGATDQEAGNIQQVFADYKKSVMFLILPQKNILFFSKSEFTKYLLKQDVQLSAVSEIHKHFLNKLSINVIQRVPAYIFQTGESIFILNSDGAISNQLAPGDIPTYPKIVLLDGSAVSSGEQVLTIDEYNFLSYMNNNFSDKTGLAIDRFEIPAKGSQQLNLITKNGFQLRFDTNAEPQTYLQRFWDIWTALTPDQQQKLIYADLRFEQNAYFCYRGDVCSSK